MALDAKENNASGSATTNEGSTSSPNNDQSQQQIVKNNDNNNSNEEPMQWTTVEEDTTVVVDEDGRKSSLSTSSSIKRTFDEIDSGSGGARVSTLSSTISNVESSPKIKDKIDDTVENVKLKSEENFTQKTSPVTFRVVYAKTSYDITMDLTDTVLDIKNKINQLTGVSSLLQKLCFKGNLSDEKTLEDCGIKDNVKIMMIGSKMTEILAVSSTSKETIERCKDSISTPPPREPLCRQKQHKKVLDRGKPPQDQLMTAWRGENCPLPYEPIRGMVNKYNQTVRLTFKLEQDEVWIGTKEKTNKIQMSSIKSVINESIEDHPEYHIMALQLGPTEQSRYWLYWVPAQFVKAIKDTILNS